MRVADLCNKHKSYNKLYLSLACFTIISQSPSSVTQVIIFLPSKMSLHGMSEYIFTVLSYLLLLISCDMKKKVIVMTNLFTTNTNNSYTTDTTDEIILNLFPTCNGVNYVYIRASIFNKQYYGVLKQRRIIYAYCLRRKSPYWILMDSTTMRQCDSTTMRQYDSTTT